MLGGKGEMGMTPTCHVNPSIEHAIPPWTWGKRADFEIWPISLFDGGMDNRDFTLSAISQRYEQVSVIFFRVCQVSTIF